VSEFWGTFQGQEGCSIFNRGKNISVQPSTRLSEKQVYGIGAGDAFAAGFIFAFLERLNLKEAGEFASRVSLIKLKQPNSHLTINNLVELEKIKHHYFSRKKER